MESAKRQVNSANQSSSKFSAHSPIASRGIMRGKGTPSSFLVGLSREGDFAPEVEMGVVRMLERSNWLIHHPLALIPDGVYERIKRAVDIMIALIAIVFLAPIGILIALLIWCEDQGTIIYTQERVGKNGKPFRFHKFRSMVCNADQIRQRLETQNEAIGPIFKMKNDPRITSVGRILRKYSLDELPQFYNVLCGDMSLVGPRPHLPLEVAKYESGQHKRLEVQPGLICLREVCGRSRLTFEDWVSLDLIYVQHRNMLLDTWILIKLIPAVLTADGAY